MAISKDGFEVDIIHRDKAGQAKADACYPRI
jgi:hypothetical protein